MNPGLVTGNYTLQPANMLLKFFLCAFIFIVIAAVQYVVYAVRNFYGAPKIQ